MQYDGANWIVSGSSTSGRKRRDREVNCTSGSWPASNPGQIYLNINATVAPKAVINRISRCSHRFENDANVQKKVQFGPSANSGSTWNNNSGRSKIELASSGGFHAVGVSTAPTLVEMLGTGGTYYTFVDSGAFTVQYASFTNMDESGIQLNGTGAFSINDSTFDYSGSGVLPVSTLFTLNGVTQSTITLVDVTYGNSRPNSANYSYTIYGASTGLYMGEPQLQRCFSRRRA